MPKLNTGKLPSAECGRRVIRLKPNLGTGIAALNTNISRVCSASQEFDTVVPIWDSRDSQQIDDLVVIEKGHLT